MDGSLQLLDVCGASKDCLLLMKECVQDLASSLRRRKGEEYGQESEIQCLKSFRKNGTKLVQKSLANLKKAKKICNSQLLVEDHGCSSIINMIKEAEAITLSVIESLLLVVSGTTNEVEKIDSALKALNREKSSKSGDVVSVQNLQKQLVSFKLKIQELEEGVESLFGHLMRIRVSLLNLLNH
ncbi:Protein BPS1, chloroplastic [Dillenia turbinata]|uniref:Protein BPS1, chloroplastic n=1 Tax=Dillenia turbinata TaxID=194707 RepID=A0AAN8VQC8_9MAGN